MLDRFPVTSSLLSPQAIASGVLPQFGLSKKAKCEYFSGGFNHTYRITTENSVVYYLRSYRKTWRTLPDIRYELDVLNHLNEKNFPAAKPVPTLEGNYYYPVNAPEGIRYIVLFTEAPGPEISYAHEPEIMARQYGRAVAHMHNTLDDFRSPHQRFQLDLDFFTQQPLKTIAPFLLDRPEDWNFVQSFAETLRQKILEVPQSSLELGFCHGDLQGYHANVSPDGTLTFFDFDCGGFGFRAYDLAVFLWCCRLQDAVATRWEPFLNAYKEMRPLNPIDEKAIPLFVCARYLWHVGVHTRNAPDWGLDFLNNEYFKDHLERLQKAQGDDLLEL